ncbi:MAG: hypothetical protein ACI4JK_06200 [Oscillospiraceae bacterium]
MGTVLNGSYVIGQLTGRGGFGVTYLAYDRNESRIVSIKLCVAVHFSEIVFCVRYLHIIHVF